MWWWIVEEMYPTISDRIVPGATFQELCMLSAQRRQFSNELVPEEFVDWRLVLLRNPKGPFEQNLSDGRCLVVKEMPQLMAALFRWSRM